MDVLAKHVSRGLSSRHNTLVHGEVVQDGHKLSPSFDQSIGDIYIRVMDTMCHIS